MSKSGGLVVVAFDFGTTYSGYAFSFRNDPLKVQTNGNWVAGSEKLISLKTPTCVLVDPNNQFHAFGFEAENKYTSLAEDNKHHGWKFFKQFKMMLHSNESLSRSTPVEDINRKQMPAMTIFAMSIRFLKEHFWESVQRQKVGLRETDVRYVITIPAIWDDNAKQFMREAAIEAGVDPDRLQLAYEPEAASMWCQLETSDASDALTGPGTQYMVVDLGGGTADISVHEKLPNGKLKAIHKASGGPWGGIYVDQNYMAMLTELFGTKAVEELRNTEMGDYVDLLREFETKKRDFSSKKGDKVTFRISAALREAFDKHEKGSLKDKIAGLQYGNALELRGSDKLRVEPKIIKRWFDGPLNQMIQHVKEILREPKMNKVTSILFVGGFGESSYAQERMVEEFRNKRLIVPKEAGLVVLKGAVRFGHDPGLVSSRILQYTYGFEGRVDYDDEIHANIDDADVEVIDDEDEDDERVVVNNGFIVLARAGDEVKFGDEKTKHMVPVSDDQLCSSYNIIRTEDPNPILSDENGCHEIGSLTVEHSEGYTVDDKVMAVTFLFGDTELKVKITVEQTGKTFFLSIDCLK